MLSRYRYFLFALLLMLCDRVSSQSFSRLEYFIDTDPGIGQAIPITVSTNADTVELDFSHAIQNLVPGTHFMHVRMLDSGGYWSPWQLHLFYVEDTVSAGNLDEAEYFIDEDAGFGIVSSLHLIPSDSIAITFQQSVAGYSEGVHFAHVRTHVSSGYWSPWQLHLFYIEDTVSSGNIDQVEYFIDEDGGFGISEQAPIAASDSIDSSFTHSLGAYSAGEHFVHVRSHVRSGYWSPWQLHLIYIEDTVNAGFISESEYFIDKDPGVGKANQIVFTPADTLEKKELIGINTLAAGPHQIMVRTKLEQGYWSPWQSHLFFIQDTLGPSGIQSVRYAVDSSLLDSSYTFQVSYAPPRDTLSDTLLSPTDTSLQFGLHEYRIWAQQENGFSSTWHKDTLYVIDCPMLDSARFTRQGNLCLGDTLLFKEDIVRLGNWPVDSFQFSWFVNGSSTLSSSADSFQYFSGASDTLVLRFKFQRIHEVRCQAEWTDSVFFIPSFRDTLSATICSIDSLFIFGNYEKLAGFYVHDTLNRFGCDSVVVFELKVNPSYSDTLFRQLCSGDSLLIHGTYQHVSGTFDSLFKTTLGCDSFVRVQLQVNPIFAQTDSVELCSGDSLFLHSRFVSQAGVYTDSFQTIHSCDSIFITSVFINSVYNDTFTTGLCGGDSLFFGNQYYTQSGFYPFLFQTTKGCDSLVTLALTVDTVIRTQVALSICLGDSILLDGAFRTVAGAYSETYQAAKGCDSLVFYSLSIIQPDSVFLFDSICQGASFSFFGQPLTQSGVYYHTLQGYRSCDSVVVLRLFERTLETSLIQDTVCFGDSIFYGLSYKLGTATYFDTLVNRYGCDSILEIQLVERPLEITQLSDTVCFGDSLFVGLSFKKGSGLFIDTLSNRFGCDSILMYEQVERSVDSVRVHFDLCAGASLFTGNSLKIAPGIYFDTLSNRLGCDSILISEVHALDSVGTYLNDTICYGSVYSFFGNSLTESGFYTEVLTANNGCDSNVHLNLFRRPQFKPFVVAAGYALLSTDTPFVSYQWYVDRDSLVGDTNRLITIQLEGVYDVSVINANGCPANSWDELLGQAAPVRPDWLIYPNPAGRQYFIKGQGDFQLKVYSGWGRVVLEEQVSDGEIRVDCSSWLPGVYYIHLYQDGYHYFSKMVIVH
ncbi:MAG: T9SS type A sorting domain-containing protein [Bacteroidetes bacterium]|nr:MAG: T9SS type A sorting domain-containing protein [Bacteroidota bacterium]